MRERKEFLVFGAPLIEESEIQEVVATLRSGWLGTGPRVKRFEAAFAAYKRVPQAAALNSATAGLHLALLTLDLQPGDEVITTPLTFCATVNTIIHAGGTPVLADVDPVTWNIDPRAIESTITPRTRAIVVVHFAGRPCAMDAIVRLARRHDLAILEDCAHAIETEYHGRGAGTFGDFGVFSFYSTKNVVTGEGGMVIASDPATLERIRVLSLHGMSRHAWQRFSSSGFKHYQVEAAGYKYNMMDIQAALGIHQLARVERNWARRWSIWQTYMRELANLPFGLPAPDEPHARHAYHLFQILVDEEKCGFMRDALLDAMTRRGIGVGVHYLALPEHPYYQQTFGWQPEQYPNAMRIGRQTLSLPLSPKMSDDDVADVISALRSALHEANHRTYLHAHFR